MTNTAPPANMKQQPSAGGASPASLKVVDSLPVTVREVLKAAANLPEAEAATAHLAHSHYENFSVVSVLLPKRLRQDFCNVYAFCRVADDLGDEVGDREQALRLLAEFHQLTEACYHGDGDTALFVALRGTIRKYDIPIQPFLDLISAFQQDQHIVRYQTFEQVVDYCRRSADPVGRLVLYMCGYRDEQRQRFSDQICTALQLTNFWQDVRRDILDRDRIYLPLDTMNRFGVTEAQIRQGRCDQPYRDLIRFEVDRTQALFDQGEALLPMLDRSVRAQVSLFARGGRSILQAIRRQNYDTLSHRPSLSKMQKGRLIASALVGYLAGRLGGSGGAK
jgi:squalene synthase HpnC